MTEESCAHEGEVFLGEGFSEEEARIVRHAGWRVPPEELVLGETPAPPAKLWAQIETQLRREGVIREAGES